MFGHELEDRVAEIVSRIVPHDDEARVSVAQRYIFEHGRTEAAFIELYVNTQPDVLDQIGSTREELKLGATLHDIGKTRVSDPSIWFKKFYELDISDLREMAKHVVPYGEEALREADHLVGPLPVVVFEMERGHHEKLDGTGKPFYLRGSQIPASAQILAVIDQIVGRCEVRANRPITFTLEKALAEVQQGRGKLYNPVVVDNVAALLGENLHMEVPELAWLGPLER